MAPLLTEDRALLTGTVVDRPNRFVVRVDFGAGQERAYLGDPGALRGIIEPGRRIRCAPVEDDGRATDYDAIAAEVDGTLVSLRAALANDLFGAAISAGLLPAFAGSEVARREPALPEHGRTDFALSGPDGEQVLVEVKSATHVDDGIAQFPDRQTERGRRHLRALHALHETGVPTHVVFVVQRPDVEALRPYRAVDPEFADLLGAVRAAGVGVHAMAVAFDPPAYRLVTPDLPVEA